MRADVDHIFLYLCASVSIVFLLRTYPVKRFYLLFQIKRPPNDFGGLNVHDAVGCSLTVL